MTQRSNKTDYTQSVLYIYVLICICRCVYMHIHVYICVCINMYIWKPICVCAFTHICICPYFMLYMGFKFFIRFSYFYFMYIHILHVYMYMHQMHAWCLYISEERSDSLELKLWMIVSHHVVTVLWLLFLCDWILESVPSLWIYSGAFHPVPASSSSLFFHAAPSQMLSS